MEFDGGMLSRFEERAKREFPGPYSETWLQRLEMIARGFGFRTLPTEARICDLARQVMIDQPVLAWVPMAVPGEGSGDDLDRDGALTDGQPSPDVADEDDAGSWLLILGMKGRKFRVPAPGNRIDHLTAGQLARRLGLPSSRSKMTFAFLEPLAPCDGLTREHLHAESGSTDAHEHTEHHPQVAPVRRLLGLMRPEWPDIHVVVAYAVGIGILMLAVPLAIEALVGTVALNMLMQQLVVIAVILFICLAFASALRVLQTYVVELIQRRLFARVAADLAYRLPRVRIEAYDRNHGPELVNRFFDILTVQKVGALLLMDGITIVLQAVFGLAVLALYHPFLLGFDLVVLGVLSFIVFQLGRGAVQTSIRESRAKYAVAGCLEEIARAPVAYKMGHAPDFAIDRTDRLTRGYLKARRDHFVILIRQIAFALGFQAVATAGMLGLGGWLVIQKQLTLGQLVAAELIVAIVVGSFAKLGKHLEGWYDLMAAVEKLGHLVDLPLERKHGEEPHFQRVGTRVRVHNVSYAYNEHQKVLNDIDLDIEPGEHVAIVGPSGSGKSTLSELLYGLRDPDHGYITLDGLNLLDLDLNAVRDEVALVKGIDVVDDTILENVRMGRNKLTLREVHDALETLKLNDVIAQLPEGVHTRLSPNGSPLSLGQVRRLMLARAVVGRPNLLVLDEALDGLDLDSREAVFDAFFNSAQGWTIIVVTHSQEVASRCNRAIALIDGRTEHGMAMENGRSRLLEDWLREVGQ